MDEWYRRGIELMSVSLFVLLFSIVSDFGFILTASMLVFGFVGVFVVEWMFTDISEEAIDKDLEKLSRDIQ